MEDKWIPSGEAVKILDRSMSALSFILKNRKVRHKTTEVNGRRYRLWSYLDIVKLAATLGPRKFSTHNAKPRLEKRTGYMIMYLPKYPGCMSNGTIYEHRVIAEQMLGRRLKAGECVHHINGVRHDNRTENLEVYPDKRAHLKHAHGKEYAMRAKLKRILHKSRNGTKKLSQKEKAELFDFLAK